VVDSPGTNPTLSAKHTSGVPTSGRYLAERSLAGKPDRKIAPPGVKWWTNDLDNNLDLHPLAGIGAVRLTTQECESRTGFDTFSHSVLNNVFSDYLRSIPLNSLFRASGSCSLINFHDTAVLRSTWDWSPLSNAVVRPEKHLHSRLAHGGRRAEDAKQTPGGGGRSSSKAQGAVSEMRFRRRDAYRAVQSDSRGRRLLQPLRPTFIPGRELIIIGRHPSPAFASSLGIHEQSPEPLGAPHVSPTHQSGDRSY